MNKLKLAALLAVFGLCAAPVICADADEFEEIEDETTEETSNGSGDGSLIGGTKIDVKAIISVVSCTGPHATCPITSTINAPAFTCCGNPTEQKVNALGSITTDLQANLVVPQKAGERSLYSFAPSEGELAGKTIYIGLERQPKRPGTRHADVNRVEVYRHVTGESLEWKRVGILSSKTELPSTISFTFKADGDATTEANPNVTFDLGDVKLQP